MADRNVKSKRQFTKANKVGLWIVSIVIFLAVVSFLVPLAQSYLLRVSLTSESKQALTENQPSIQGKANAYLKMTAQKLGANPAAVYSIAFNSCYTDHSDSGWVANSYNYSCLITNFAFFEVNDGSTLIKAIDQYARPALREGGSDNSNYYGKIYTLNTGFDETLANIEDLPFVVDVVKNNTYTNVQEVLTLGTVNNSPNVVAYANDEAIANRSILDQRGTQTLGTRKTYIVLKSGEEYFRKDVGCRVPTLMSCNSPI